MSPDKKYIIVKDRHPRISDVLNDNCTTLCVPTYKNEPLSSILKKICSKITNSNHEFASSPTIEFVQTGNVITANVIGGVTSYTDEDAQDAIAVAFAAGTQTGLTISYNDSSNSFSFSVLPEFIQDSIGSALSTEFTYNDGANTISINQIDWSKIINFPGFENIYNTDGTLTNIRTVNMDGFSLNFVNNGLFRIEDGDLTEGGIYDFNQGIDFVTFDTAKSTSYLQNLLSGIQLQVRDITNNLYSRITLNSGILELRNDVDDQTYFKIADYSNASNGDVLSLVDSSTGEVGWVSAGSGSGDMMKSVYDPQNISDDVFDRTNHTGTQLLSTISDVTASVSEVNILDGATITTSELNILDGVTSTAFELNILDGATLSTIELNYVDGVTSNIQTQLDGKQATISTLVNQVIVGTGTNTVAGNSGLTFDGTSLGIADGSSGSAGLKFNNGGGGNLGFYRDATNRITFQVGSTNYYSFNSSMGFQIHSDSFIGWSSSANSAGTIDTRFYRDGAGVLAQRNGTNAQEFRVYNTDNGANDEFVSIGWLNESNVLQISTEETGSGAQRNIKIIAPNVDISQLSIAGEYTLPVVDGTNGQVLSTDGSGTVSWQTVSGGGSGTVNSGTANRLAYYASSGTAVDDLAAITANRALISDASGLPTHSSVTNTELGYVSGVTSSIQTQINNRQALDATLTALAAYNTNGLLTQTAADTFTGRTLTGTANRITITNGSGVSGNPTVDISSTYVGQATITTVGTIATGTWNATAISTSKGGTPTGGTTGQVLTKNSGSNYDYSWQTPSGGGSGITRSVSSINSNTTGGTTASTDYVYFCSGNITFTLPTASGNSNKYTLVKTDSSNTVTISNAVVSLSLNTQYESKSFISNGTSWYEV